MWTNVLIVIAVVLIGGALVWLNGRLRGPQRFGEMDPLQRRRDLDMKNEQTNLPYGHGGGGIGGS